MGTNTFCSVDLAPELGAVSSNLLGWWVTAWSADAALHVSMTNQFAAFLTQRSRVTGTVVNGSGAVLDGALIECAVLPGGWLFTDAGGRFDLGSPVIRQVLDLKVTPSGRHGVFPILTNFAVPAADLDLRIVLTNGQSTNSSGRLSEGANPPAFFLQPGSVLTVQRPAAWTSAFFSPSPCSPSRGEGRRGSSRGSRARIPAT